MGKLAHHVWASRLGSNGEAHATRLDGTVVALCGAILSQWNTTKNRKHCKECSRLLPVAEATAVVRRARYTVRNLTADDGRERARQRKKAEERAEKIAQAKWELHRAKERLEKARTKP